MILYLLLKAVLYIISIIASVFGDLIPSFPSAISSVLTTISSMLNSGISFISYFFYIPVVVGLISLVIAWHGFKVVKDSIMKVVGHFIAN